MKIYKSIDTIPIFNFWKLQTTNERRYLAVDWQNIEVLEVSPDVLIAQKNILEQMDGISFDIPNAYLKCQKLMGEFFTEKYKKSKYIEKKRTKFNFAFVKYLDLLNIGNKSFEIGDLKSDNLRELYKEYKSNTSSYFNTQLYDFSFTQLKYESSNTWELYNEVYYLKKHLKIDIDLKKISAAEYFVIKKQASEEIEKLNKLQKEKENARKY